MGALLALVSGVEFSPVFLMMGYAIMLPAHLSLSYSNNYFDMDVDQYNNPISISGGTKILIENPELKPLCRNIAILLIIISIVIATIFTLFFSFSLYFLGFIIFGNLLGWFYTAPPIRLAYRGFGEVANMINMGLLMPGIGYWVMKGNIDLFFLIFSAAFFIYGLEFMIIVEIPDMEGDIKGKKKTLVTRLGRKTGYQILLVSLIISSLYYLVIYYLGFFQEYINFFIVFLLSLIPLSFGIIGWIKKPFDKKTSTKIAQRNMSILILCVLLLNLYFVLAIFV